MGKDSRKSNKTSPISKINGPNKSTSPKSSPKTKSGDNAKSSAKISPSEAIPPPAPSTTSTHPSYLDSTCTVAIKYSMEWWTISIPSISKTPNSSTGTKSTPLAKNLAPGPNTLWLVRNKKYSSSGGYVIKYSHPTKYFPLTRPPPIGNYSKPKVHPSPISIPLAIPIWKPTVRKKLFSFVVTIRKKPNIWTLCTSSTSQKIGFQFCLKAPKKLNKVAFLLS